jgi:hypothetical protein
MRHECAVNGANSGNVYRYEIDVRIGNRIFPSLLVIADDVGDGVILGRDLLNQLRFLYDGPASQFILVE